MNEKPEEIARIDDATRPGYQEVMEVLMGVRQGADKAFCAKACLEIQAYAHGKQSCH